MKLKHVVTIIILLSGSPYLFGAEATEPTSFPTDSSTATKENQDVQEETKTASQSSVDQELHSAIKEGILDRVQELISTVNINQHLKAWLTPPRGRSVAPKQTPANPYTPLGLAARHGHTAIVQFLLTQPDIDVNAVSMQTDKTSLFLASQYGHLDCVKALCQHQKIKLTKPNKANLTPIGIARKKEHTEVIQYLKSIQGT